MACPHVSGGAALVLEANPRMKASAVLRELTETAVKGALSGLKLNDVNVLLYVGEGGAPPAPPAPPTPTWAPPPSPAPSSCPYFCKPNMCSIYDCRSKCDYC